MAVLGLIVDVAVRPIAPVIHSESWITGVKWLVNLHEGELAWD